MVHVFILRSCPSFVQGKNVIMGTHERVELEINKRKYVVKGKMNKGFNTPHSSEWHIMEYRMKEECVPMFLRDLNCRILNPEKKIGFFNLLFSRLNKESHVTIGYGKLFLFVGFLFKLLYFFVPNCPFKPLPEKASGEPETFIKRNTGWCYNIGLGMIKDKRFEGVEVL